MRIARWQPARQTQLLAIPPDRRRQCLKQYLVHAGPRSVVELPGAHVGRVERLDRQHFRASTQNLDLGLETPRIGALPTLFTLSSVTRHFPLPAPDSHPLVVELPHDVSTIDSIYIIPTDYPYVRNRNWTLGSAVRMSRDAIRGRQWRQSVRPR